MAKTFKALENGTMSNPYRFIVKGAEVPLSDDEAEFYKDCNWLVPLKKANAMVEPPLMSHMNLSAVVDRKTTAMEAINQLPIDPAYQAQMDTIVAGEKANDAKANGAADNDPANAGNTGGNGQGTGNTAVI